MGCTHSQRDPTREYASKTKLIGEVKKYRKYKYVEQNEDELKIPKHQTVGPVIDNFSMTN